MKVMTAAQWTGIRLICQVRRDARVAHLATELSRKVHGETLDDQVRSLLDLVDAERRHRAVALAAMSVRTHALPDVHLAPEFALLNQPISG